MFKKWENASGGKKEDHRVKYKPMVSPKMMMTTTTTTTITTTMTIKLLAPVPDRGGGRVGGGGKEEEDVRTNEKTIKNEIMIISPDCFEIGFD